MSETALKNRISGWLKKLVPDVWFFKTHGSPYQRRGIPDFLICWKGQWYAFECKVGKNKPTRSQLFELAALKAAGAVTGVVHSLDEVKRLLDWKGTIL